MKKNKKISTQDYLKYYYDVPYEGSTSAGKPLRKLKNIICPYRGIKIISSENIKDFEKKLEKCVVAIDFFELLNNYYPQMLPTEKEIYAIFKEFINLNPDDSLQNCLQMIRGSALTKLKLE